MCLYMSVPQWLNLQKFLKAINESINHTIDVSFMFIYFKCLNNTNNKNKANPSAKQIGTTKQTNQEKTQKIDLNVNLKKINSFDKFTLHKTCCEISQLERTITRQEKQHMNQEKQLKRQKYPKQQLQHQQQLHHHNHLSPYQQQEHHSHRQQAQCHHPCSRFSQDQLLLMDKFKTLPLHI